MAGRCGLFGDRRSLAGATGLVLEGKVGPHRCPSVVDRAVMVRAPVLPHLLVALATLCVGGCNETALQTAPDGGMVIAGLSPDQASRVLAKVGDKVITVGDFAQSLERMDAFDRLRYQTAERRRELLKEMIDVELLAMEARRRGLDKQPENELSVRQILRDAMLARTRQDLPAPAEIPASEVRAYFEANADKFLQPERRRVAAIVVADKKEADKILKAALGIKSASEWGELFFKHSLTAPKQRGPNSPADLAGDLGIVGPPEDARGKNSQVPEPVREAVFKIPKVGQVLDTLVEADGKQYVVRMSGITEAHSRTLAEADRSIRVALLQQKIQEREKALDAQLRKKYPVEIDDRALSGIKLPGGIDRGEGPPPSGTGETPAVQ
jgi:peptidyl-prolyl cis-trans isomerase C